MKASPPPGSSVFCGPRRPRWARGGHPDAGGGGLGLGGRAMQGGGRRGTEPKGTRDPAVLARGPLGGPEGRSSGQRTFPPPGQPRRLLLQPPALGPTWWPLDLGPRMEGHGVNCLWTLQGKCFEFCWKRREETGRTESALAGTWKELTRPHVATDRTSLLDSTGLRGGLKAPVLRGTEGSLRAPGDGGGRPESTGKGLRDKQPSLSQPSGTFSDPARLLRASWGLSAVQGGLCARPVQGGQDSGTSQEQPTSSLKGCPRVWLQAP